MNNMSKIDNAVFAVNTTITAVTLTAYLSNPELGITMGFFGAPTMLFTLLLGMIYADD